MKKTYLKPTMQVVTQKYRTILLCGSLTSIQSNLTEEDNLIIEENPQSIWSR